MGRRRFLALAAAPAGLVAALALGQVLVRASGDPFPQPGFHNLRYDPPTSPPKITQDEAIAIVRARAAPAAAKQATSITALYVLFSNDGDYREDAQGVRHYEFQRRPAWVVTLHGVNIPSKGGRRPRHGEQAAPPSYFHEWNVVIDAETGAYLESFANR